MPDVEIKGTGAIDYYNATIRKPTDPVPQSPTNNTVNPDWRIPNLSNGGYIFNVSFDAMVGQTVTFKFTNANPTSAASFNIAGNAGTLQANTIDIAFTV